MTRDQENKQRFAVQAFVNQVPTGLLRAVMIESIDMSKLIDLTDAQLLRIPGVGIKNMTKLRTLLELYREKQKQWAS